MDISGYLRSDNTEDMTYVGKDVFVHQSHIYISRVHTELWRIMNM